MFGYTWNSVWPTAQQNIFTSEQGLTEVKKKKVNILSQTSYMLKGTQMYLFKTFNKLGSGNVHYA